MFTRPALGCFGVPGRIGSLLVELLVGSFAALVAAACTLAVDSYIALATKFSSWWRRCSSKRCPSG